MEVKYVVLDNSIRFAELERCMSVLPPERQEKIARYRFEKDKLRSLVAGVLIYRATGGAGLCYGEHEKPYLIDNSMFFSVSHSGEIVAIATDDAEIGCDVEEIPTDDRIKIADRFYHPNERKRIDLSDDKPREFCRIWTRKESYLKMTGEGISTDLTAFDTTLPPLADKLYTFDLEGCALSVCSSGTISEDDVNISKIELNDLFKGF